MGLLLRGGSTAVVCFGRRRVHVEVRSGCLVVVVARVCLKCFLPLYYRGLQCI